MSDVGRLHPIERPRHAHTGYSRQLSSQKYMRTPVHPRTHVRTGLRSDILTSEIYSAADKRSGVKRAGAGTDGHNGDDTFI